MNIGILGTGAVARTLGACLLGLGNEVMLGSRGNPAEEAVAWAAETGAGARLDTFAAVAAFGEMLVNATSGSGSIAALGSCASADLEDKTLLDLANPLDFSQGFPPSLSIVNDDSLGEMIQAQFPGLRVVKTFNTISAVVMVDPACIPGHHTIFHSGNDAAAKAEVKALQVSMGWAAEDILDLGDISTARGTEMYLPLWLRMFGVVGKPAFNVHVVQG